MAGRGIPDQLGREDADDDAAVHRRPGREQRDRRHGAGGQAQHADDALQAALAQQGQRHGQHAGGLEEPGGGREVLHHDVAEVKHLPAGFHIAAGLQVVAGDAPRDEAVRDGRGQHHEAAGQIGDAGAQHRGPPRPDARGQAGEAEREAQHARELDALHQAVHRPVRDHALPDGARGGGVDNGVERDEGDRRDGRSQHQGVGGARVDGRLGGRGSGVFVASPVVAIDGLADGCAMLAMRGRRCLSGRYRHVSSYWPAPLRRQLVQTVFARPTPPANQFESHP
jgi:hypothetical protein